jgi:membrane protein
MSFITQTMQKIDAYQQKHLVFGFPYAVLKKYGADNGGYLSALVTYYGILSLFPLLLVFTALSQLLLKNNTELRNKIATSITHYFPIIGGQLQSGIHSTGKTGIALIVSLVITLYGARSGANAFQYALNTMWYIPKTKQPPFLKNVLRSLSIIIVGGLGVVAATVISSYTTFLSHLVIVKLLATLFSALILWATFIYLFKLAIAGNKAIRDVLIGAGIATIGIQILQTLGSAILAHELKGLHSSYGTFALVIGLMFWVYLQAEVVLYAVEISVVMTYKLFPRSLYKPLTERDKEAYTRYTKSTQQHAEEKVKVTFKDR